MTTKLAFALALTMPAAALAQPAPPPRPPAAAPDPAKLTAATKAVAALVPDGIYMRLMREQLPVMMDAMMAQMGGMTGAQMGIPGGTDSSQTLDQMSRKADPAFKERMSIMTRVMGEEMGRVFGPMEPRLRAGMSRAFARRFTLAQLNDMNAFFATPSGRAFGADYLATFMDPEVMQEMMGMMPEIMKAMPEMMKRVEAATKHLPPPTKKAGADAGGNADDD